MNYPNKFKIDQNMKLIILTYSKGAFFYKILPWSSGYISNFFCKITTVLCKEESLQFENLLKTTISS